MSKKLAVTALVLALVALSSCGGSNNGGVAPDVTAPTVSQMSITDGTTDVGLVQQLLVTFSEPLDAATVNDTTFVVAGRSATGYVEYNESTRTASFLPDTLYAQETWHNLVITDDVTDEAGNAYEGGTTSFQTGDLSCDNLLDRFEPNGTAGAAPVMELDRLYPTLTACGQDDDFYLFTLEEAAKVTVQTDFTHADDVNWGIHFVRPDGTNYEATLGALASTGNSRTFSYSFPTGTHGVRIFGYQDPVYVLYDLTLVTSAPCVEDEYEDNDFREDAVPVTPGLMENLRGCYLDPDYFSFDVTTGQTVTVTTTQLNVGDVSNCRIRIFDPAGLQTADGEPQSPYSLSAVMTESGTCEIMAMFWDDRGYDLEIVVAD